MGTRQLSYYFDRVYERIYIYKKMYVGTGGAGLVEDVNDILPAA